MQIFLNSFPFVLNCTTYVRQYFLVEVHHFVVLHLVLATIPWCHLVRRVQVGHIALVVVVVHLLAPVMLLAFR